MQGAENVYTQHTPHLSQTLENLFRGRLKDTSYPFLEGTPANAGLQRLVFPHFIRHEAYGLQATGCHHFHDWRHHV